MEFWFFSVCASQSFHPSIHPSIHPCVYINVNYFNYLCYVLLFSSGFGHCPLQFGSCWPHHPPSPAPTSIFSLSGMFESHLGLVLNACSRSDNFLKIPSAPFYWRMIFRTPVQGAGNAGCFWGVITSYPPRGQNWSACMRVGGWVCTLVHVDVLIGAFLYVLHSPAQQRSF